MKKKVVFILGPTAVGKTYFSVMLAKKYNGEIISADSVQIYKGLNIGSAKVTEEEMSGIKHYAIDILEPEQEFSVYDFVEYTKQKIDEILQKGKLPIIVGGTALYVKALTLGYNFGGVEKDDNLRKQLEDLAKEKGNEHLYEMLKEKNPDLAEKTDKHNTVRLVRALEIALSNGKKDKVDVDIEPLILALNKDRALLYDAINKRVDIMLENGLIEEVEGLKKRGLSRENQSMRAIDYKEVLGYLEGEYDYDRMVELLKQHSRNYAKRQLTFLRGMDDVNFVDVQDLDKAKNQIFTLVEEFLK
ncbi:MAG: tRNA (adenosine(37)-N6)-dimethylallyltransferase MiaA [Clostridiales bacterium]|nr:tRNA (adenosine(37)-N6)-dimethylallyltransferase MiaA [Clostridiales bacterium]